MTKAQGHMSMVLTRGQMDRAIAAAARVGHKIDLKLREYMIMKGSELPKIYDAVEYDQQGKVVYETTVIEEV